MTRLDLQEQLLATLDVAFAQVRPGDFMHALSFQTSLNIVDRIEEILKSDLARPIYSSELAARLHVSVRTINSAMSKIRGTSLHRYLRSRRLWSVRRQLLVGDETTQIKDHALANGFWHLSEFSSQYVRKFGEHPSRLWPAPSRCAADCPAMRCVAATKRIVRTSPSPRESGERVGVRGRSPQIRCS